MLQHKSNHCACLSNGKGNGCRANDKACQGLCTLDAMPKVKQSAQRSLDFCTYVKCLRRPNQTLHRKKKRDVLKKKDSNNKLTTQPNASSVVAFWASFLCSGEIKMKLEFLQTASLRACFDFVADGTADVVVVVIAILTALSAACACIGIFYMLTVCVFYKSFCFAAAFWRAIFVLSRCCVALSVVAVVVVTVVICISRFAACLIRNSSYKHNNNKQT